MKRETIFTLVMVVLLLTGVELLSSILVSSTLRNMGVVYDPSTVPSYQSYKESMHEDFGWPAQIYLQPPHRNYLGARNISSNFPSDNSCVSAYGESVAYGHGLGDDETWTHLLSNMLGCPVANFAVNGYGLDQSLLRYQHNKRDKARIVILAQSAVSISRVVSRFRPLEISSQPYVLKPRFVIDAKNSLKLVAMPKLTKSEYETMAKFPNSYLQHDYFLPGGLAGVTSKSFPNTLTLVRGLQHFRLRSLVNGKRWYVDFYQPGHNSKALDVSIALFKSFANDVKTRGGIPIAMIFPGAYDFEYQNRHGVWGYESLANDLKENEIRMPLVGKSMAERFGSNNPCDYYKKCGPHPNAKGSKQIAEILYNYLKSEKLM